MNFDILIPFSILTASFFGSWHCAAMCGPIASHVSQHGGLKLYHFGRFMSYVSLGMLAGILGNYFLDSKIEELRTASVVVFSFFLLSSGITHLKGKELPLPKIATNAFIHLQKIGQKKSAFVVGLLTSLLPCGWLYTFVLSAGATKSPWAGALVMLLFWLGSLPTMLAVPLMIRKSMQKANGWHQKIAGILLLVAAFYALAAHFAF